MMEVALMVVLYMWSEMRGAVAPIGGSSLVDNSLSMFYDRQNEKAYCAYGFYIVHICLLLIL